MGKKEGEIEKYLIKTAKKHDFLHYKFTSPSNSGVPDRVIIGHAHDGPRTIFVELKAPGETLRPLQVAVTGIMTAHGADVRVIDSKAQIDELFAELLGHDDKSP